mmetsp:Transcript_25172/g.35264  ORF Transcript_25172/g.35264 Transcript_25172/m.35264 type:complete len:219 (-) Transcript_25172:748-1404(-)
MQGGNEIDAVLGLLKQGSLEDATTEEFDLMSELKKQVMLLYINFTTNGENTDSQQLRRCAEYIEDMLNDCDMDTSKNVKNPRHHQDSQVRVKQLGVVTTEFTEGKLIYLMDGEPIKFKKVKDTTVYHRRWEENFKELINFYKLHGHCRVTRSTEGYEELGNWVTEQRRKLKKGKVSQRQFEMLHGLGFEWDRSHYFFRTYHKKKPEEEPTYSTKDDNV